MRRWVSAVACIRAAICLAGLCVGCRYELTRSRRDANRQLGHDSAPAPTPDIVRLSDSGPADHPAFDLVDAAGDSTAPFCQGVSEIPHNQCNALVALYVATQGANWSTKSGWLATSTPCSWYGVTCSDPGGISSILLAANNLVGRLPEQIADVSTLVTLDLSNNALQGEIPDRLGELLHLSDLRLQGNLLSGTIPASLGQLAKATRIFLGANQLSGSIPTTFGNLTRLRDLYLDANRLSGPMPSELARLSALSVLLVNNNQLSGEIPTEFSQLANLNRFEAFENQLTGFANGVVSGWLKISRLHLTSNLMDQAAIDELLRQLHESRAVYVAATISVFLQGNAAPSGSLTDPIVTPGVSESNGDWRWDGSAHYPTSGKAYVYDLMHDVRAEGFSRWAITHSQ